MAASSPRKTTKTIPAALEAVGETTAKFDYNGIELEALLSTEWPFEALEAYEAGKVATFVGHILTPESYVAFKATGPKVADLKDLVEAIREGLGISGN